MEYLTERRFSFVSSALPAETFGVVRFTGMEALSSLYEFDIMLVTHDPAIDLGALLQQPALFSILRPDGDQVDFNGILANCEQLHEYNGCVFYRALLRPRLWWLTLTRHNQVCLNMPVVPGAGVSSQASLIGQCLNDGGLTSLDYEFRTQKGYDLVEYACQYNETHYNFIARWLEREGLYYFFEQTDHGEKLVLTDTRISHVELPQEGILYYAPPSGLDSGHRDEVIQVLTCRQQQLPQTVLLKDYNYERPGLDLNGQAEVDPQGRGEFYIYGDFFSTPEEGNRLAQLRAEELLCRQTEYFGEGSVPFMMPGYTFRLKEHYRPDFNRRYLVTEVRHCGNQSGYLISGLQGGIPDNEKTVSYSNQFTAIAADVQFRPERKAQKPRISGTLHATIDAEGSGEYAELDGQGRYKVRLPFDINSQHGSGKASCFLRMAQPYAGSKRGMHFPLPKGTEVLLTFIDGDPDRPVIAAAVPNPETPSPTTASNQTESVIQTGGNNKIRIEDKKGSERIIMQSPTANSWMRIGAPNDPITTINESAGNGIRIHSEHDLWLEAHQQYGEYRCGKNDGAPHKTADSNTPLIGDMLDHFTDTTGYYPKNILNRHSGEVEQWEADVLPNAHLRVSSLDTVSTQEGNIYDFGGYWNYNLGNSYAENFIDQQATLNTRQDQDLLNVGGPNFTSLIFPSLPDGADASLEGSWPPSKGMWVGKKIGNSYDYVNGDAVGVTVGSSLNITHGGRHVEVKYRDDGSLAAWSKEEGGKSSEKKWVKDGETNFLYFESDSDFKSMTSSETVYDRYTKAFAKYSTQANSGGRMASFDVTLSATATSEIKLAAASAFSLSVAAKIDVELSAAASAKIGIGAALELEMWWNPSGKLKLKNGKFEYHGIGSQLDKEEAIKAKVQSMILEDSMCFLDKKQLHLENDTLKLGDNVLQIKKGIQIGV